MQDKFCKNPLLFPWTFIGHWPPIIDIFQPCGVKRQTQVQTSQHPVQSMHTVVSALVCLGGIRKAPSHKTEFHIARSRLSTAIFLHRGVKLSTAKAQQQRTQVQKTCDFGTSVRSMTDQDGGSESEDDDHSSDFRSDSAGSPHWPGTSAAQ